MRCRQSTHELLRGHSVVVGAKKILQRRDCAEVGLHVPPAAEQPSVEFSAVAQVLQNDAQIMARLIGQLCQALTPLQRAVSQPVKDLLGKVRRRGG